MDEITGLRCGQAASARDISKSRRWVFFCPTRDRRASPAGSAPIVSRQQHAALQVKNQDSGARHGSRSCRFRPNSYWVAPGAATGTAPPLTAAASAAACFFSSAATTVASPAGSQALKAQGRILKWISGPERATFLLRSKQRQQKDGGGEAFGQIEPVGVTLAAKASSSASVMLSESGRSASAASLRNSATRSAGTVVPSDGAAADIRLLHPDHLV